MKFSRKRGRVNEENISFLEREQHKKKSDSIQATCEPLETEDKQHNLHGARTRLQLINVLKLKTERLERTRNSLCRRQKEAASGL